MALSSTTWSIVAAAIGAIRGGLRGDFCTPKSSQALNFYIKYINK